MAISTAIGNFTERFLPSRELETEEALPVFTFFPGEEDLFDGITGEDLLALIVKAEHPTLEYLYEAHIRNRYGAIHRAASILGPNARSIMENLNDQVLVDSIKIVQNTPDGLVYLKKFLTDTYELLILGANQMRMRTPLSDQQYAGIEDTVNSVALKVIETLHLNPQSPSSQSQQSVVN